MFNATLHFTSFEQLWKFKVKVHSRSIIVRTKLNVLIAELLEEEIQAACNYYNATIVRKDAVRLSYT